MSGVTRTGDLGIGTCPAHQSPVTYISSFISSNTGLTADGVDIVTVGDIGICSCGHPSIALTGSSIGTVAGKGIHRVGDSGTNPGAYIAISGSSIVDSL